MGLLLMWCFGITPDRACRIQLNHRSNSGLPQQKQMLQPLGFVPGLQYFFLSSYDWLSAISYFVCLKYVVSKKERAMTNIQHCGFLCEVLEDSF